MARISRNLTALAVALLLPASAFAGGGKGQKAAHMDTDNDGRVSQAEHDAWAQQRFASMDTDGNGRLGTAELEGRGMGRGRGAMPGKLQGMDTNMDGVVSAEEHLAGSRDAFARLDSNSDGFLSNAERQADRTAMWMDDDSAAAAQAPADADATVQSDEDDDY
jgi:hypothetical protein